MTRTTDARLSLRIPLEKFVVEKILPLGTSRFCSLFSFPEGVADKYGCPEHNVPKSRAAVLGVRIWMAMPFRSLIG